MSKSAKIRAIPKLVETIALSNNEATVLLPIIRGGNLTAGAIAEVVGQPLTKVGKPLKSLIDKGLVEKIDGIVPLYRASPPILPMTDTLESFIDYVEKISSTTTASVQKILKSNEKTLASVIKTNEDGYDSLNTAFEEYENEVVSTVLNHITKMTELTSEILNEYAQKIHTALDSMNASLEVDMGEKLSLLQSELDSSQKQLAIDTKRITKDFQKWLSQEKTATLTSVKDIDKKSTNLISTAKKVLEAALKSSEKALIESSEQLSTLLGEKALESSNTISEILINLSETLKQKSSNFNSLIGQNLTSSKKTLTDTVQEAQQNADSQAEVMQKRFDETLNVAKAFGDNIELWKEEVTNYMETASQSVLAQLEQLNSSEKSFLEVVRSSLTGHIEKTNASIGDEYKSLRNLARNLTSDTDTLMSDARSSVLELLQSEVTGNKERLQQTNESLQQNIASWGEKASKAIDKKINSAVKEVSTVLDTETAEFNSLTDNIASRLKSSFSGVISTTETKNEAAVSTIKRIASDYESSLESKLGEIANEHFAAIQKQVGEAKALYESLNQRLSKRLTESSSSLNSQVARTQKEIDTSIVEQVERIDRHVEEIRSDFRSRIEEMTQQFVTVTQSIESSFNGLVASQSVEARDLIASAHTEFKNVMKSEMESLDSDSIKLQQEFASEIGMRIDSVMESTASLKRGLDEFTSEKRNEISKNMEDAISSIEQSLSAAQEGLVEIETGTVKQFADNVQQLTKEFGISVAGARDNIAERLKSITVESSDILVKNAINVKTTVDAYLSEEMESMQRVLAETSKKLDKLAAANIKKTTEKVDEFFRNMDQIQELTATTRIQARDEIMKEIENRRAETVVAFDAASVWIDSAMDNVSTSLETLGSKMNNDVLHVQQNLGKSFETAMNGMRERAQSHISQLDEVGKSFLQHVDSLLDTSINEFNNAGETSLNAAIDSLSEFPEKIAQVAEQVGKSTLAESKARLTAGGDEVSQQIADLDTSSKSMCDDMTSLVSKIEAQMSQVQENTVEQIQQAALISNQHASRKFESIGVEMKAAFSSATFEIVDSISAEVKDSTSQIQEHLKSGSGSISATRTNLQGARTELIKSVSDGTTESLNTWAESARDTSMKLSTTIQESNNSAAEGARNTTTMLKAIFESTDELKPLPSENTWYLSGKDEICAQIQDMAKTVERSILISIPQMDCLDLKKLAKVKTPTRKVLVIPQSEDKDPDLELLKGWRIWELQDPMLLAVADEKEILLGGLPESEVPICLVSRDNSYLQIYHEIVGPKIVADAIK